MAALPDRADLLARISGLDDEELGRIVEMLDAGAFFSDPIIFEEGHFIDYADEESKRLHIAQRKADKWEAISLIPALLTNEAFIQLQREVQGRRQRVFERVARSLAMSNEPLDQRLHDQVRGYWEGAIYATHRLPAMIEKARMRRALSRQEEGAED